MPDWITSDDYLKPAARGQVHDIAAERVAPAPEKVDPLRAVPKPLELLRDCCWARLTGGPEEAVRWLEEYTSVEDGGYWHQGQRIANVKRMLTPQGWLPAGLVDLVVAAAPLAGHRVVVQDDRSKPCGPDPRADVGWLRPDQVVALEALVQAERGILEAPTGSGKTEVFIALTLRLPCEWLFVVHRADLVGQTAERYRARTGERAGTFERGEWRRGTANVTVATFQAVRRAAKDRRRGWLEFREAVQALFVDEVHAQPADDFYRGTLSFTSAYYRFGGSATPLERGDLAAIRTIGALGPVAHQVTVPQLVALGLLAEPRVRMVRIKHTFEPEWSWPEVNRRCVVENQARNALVADLAELAPKPALLFVEKLHHAALLLPELGARGLLAEVVEGKVWVDRRRHLLDQLADGRLDVLICTIVFQEGVDVPNLRSVINAAGGASSVAALQRIGRGMRRQPDKPVFWVWDLHDRSQKWLRAHSKAREAAYRSRQFSVQIVEPEEALAPENLLISPKL